MEIELKVLLKAMKEYPQINPDTRIKKIDTYRIEIPVRTTGMAVFNFDPSCSSYIPVIEINLEPITIGGTVVYVGYFPQDDIIFYNPNR